MNEYCPFCQYLSSNRIVKEHGSVIAILDKFPVTKNHYLIIPKRHVETYFEMSAQERQDADTLLLVLKEKCLQEDPSIKGFNIGMNCGSVSGQSVMHAHIHLIPRRAGDVADPKGGVRGVIPEKQKY